MTRGLQAALAMFLVALLAIGLAAPGPFGGGPISVTPGSRLTTLELGHPTDTTLGRGAAGHLTVEGKRVWRDGDSQAVDDSGGSIAWDVALGRGATYASLDGAHVFANPTNLQSGGIYFLGIAQDATGGWRPTWGTTYERAPSLYESPSAVTSLMFAYDGVKLRVLQEAPQIREIYISARPSGSAPGAAVVNTNMVAALTEWGGSNPGRMTVDLRSVREVQLTVGVGAIAAVAGSRLAVMGSQDNWATKTHMDGDASADPITAAMTPSVAIDGVSTQVVSSWVTLDAAHKTATTSLSAWASGGDGVVDPVFTYIVLRVR